jgi:hypothetical protein
MGARTWEDATLDAVRREAARNPGGRFSRESLITNELERIVAETGSDGKTPHQTLS